MEWKKNSFFKGILIIIVQGILQESVIELPMQTVATLLIQGVGGGGGGAGNKREQSMIN